jgi:outer membrane receptor protein involved in Fe transport
LSGAKSLYHYKNPKQNLTGNLSYKLNTIHSLNLNYTYNGFQNNTTDEYDLNINTKDNINKQIIGFSYQQSLINNKWGNTFFVKNYRLNVVAELNTTRSYLTGESIDANQTTNNYGYGIASRYKILKNSGIKTSYEHAYRLQAPYELLGDGVSVIPNFNLKPESSNNINIGVYIGFNVKQKHRFFIEGGWFYRNVVDYIYSVPDEVLGISQYENVSNVKVDGYEAELKYTYNNFLILSVNASYQNAINTTRGDRDVPEITYLNRLPNRPWFFGNTNLSIGKNNVFNKENTRLQFNWNTQYVHWFYLTWDAFGSAKSKAQIPTQLIHNTAITYSIKNGKYNFSVECNNLTNTLAYDNYKLQKPGRSISIKLRAFLN